MAKETVQVADYAVSCRYDDFPSDVIERAKHCITDTIATIIFGYDLPWSRIAVAFAEKNGAGGKSRILGPGGARVHAPSAALANGCLAHAFEMDNLTWPSTGVHPGATLLAPGLAVAQERGNRRTRADHRLPRRRRGHDPDRARNPPQQRGSRLPRARHHRPVRRGDRLRAA